MKKPPEACGKVCGQSPFWEKKHIMGVVNVTPDSFSDGGKFINLNKAIEHGLSLVQQGATILDIGGESTRPGAEPIGINEEIDRICPVIEGLRGALEWVSVDTRHAEVMNAALKSGAIMVNDISALQDSKSMDVIKQAQVPVCLMHMQGTPLTMQQKPIYNNVVEEIYQFLQDRIFSCETHGIETKMLLVDPGIGFGKTLEHNLLILRNIREFLGLNVPVVVGLSRKSMIGALDSGASVDNRLGGSLAGALWCLQNGVQIVRVHDVQETQQAFKIYQAILEAEQIFVSESGKMSSKASIAS